MATYCYVCRECGDRTNETFPMGSAPDAQTCGICLGEMRRDYVGEQKQIRVSFWFNRHSFHDRIPPEVKGAGPASKAYRDYAATVETPKSRAVIAPSTLEGAREMLERKKGTTHAT